MTTDPQEPIGSNDVAVTVEMGDEFVPGKRTAAALAELVEALNDEHGPETEGFRLEAPLEIRSFSFATSQGSYNYFEAWPSKWKGFSLDGKGTDV
jgi:hypothetical protein